jgi:hypothetical protein
MTTLPTKQRQPENLVNENTRMSFHHRVSIKSMGGIDAAVIVTVVQGKVWITISPRLWDKLKEHHHAWKTAGSPTHDRLGITITPGTYEHHIWIGHPDNPVLTR